MSLLDQILTKLTPTTEKSKWPDSKGEYWALCPFHPDTHATNFSVSERGYKCFACGAQGSLHNLAQHLGVETRSDSKYKAQKKTRLSATEARQRLHERGLRDEILAKAGWVEDEKKQAWRYPVEGGYRYKAFNSDAHPKYWHDRGVRNQLYGAKWLGDDTEIWWVGGEPDCLICWQAGLPAVCAFGEGNVPRHAIEILKNKNVDFVHIVLDRDEAGQRGAQIIADALYRAGIFAVVHELPPELGEHGDVGKLYLWHHCDDEAFVKAMRSLPETEGPPTATVVELSAAVGEIDWLWEKWLPIGFVTILAGEPGVGKSAVALRLAQSITEMMPWPDGQKAGDTYGHVLWCDTEASQAILNHRIKTWNLRFPEYIFLPGSDPLVEMRLDDPDSFRQMRMIVAAKSISLVVIDSLRGSHRLDENSSELIEILSDLACMARDYECAVLVIHHLRKRSAMEPATVTIDRIRGSSAISAMARVIFCMETVEDRGEQKLRMRQIKNNLALMPEPLGVEITEHGVFFGEAPEEPRVETVMERAMEFLRAMLQSGAKKASEIIEEAELAGISKPTLYRAKEKAKVISIRDSKGYWVWSFPYED